MYIELFSRRTPSLALLSGALLSGTLAVAPPSGSPALAAADDAAIPALAAAPADAPLQPNGVDPRAIPRGRSQRGGGSPSRGLRPIGAPSPVDAFANLQPRSAAAAEDPAAPIAQAAYMQGGMFNMPPGASGGASNGNEISRPAPAIVGGNGFTTPPAAAPLQSPPLVDGPTGGTPPQVSPAPSTSGAPLLGDGLQPVPSSGPLMAPPQRPAPGFPSGSSPSDFQAVPQPRLGSTWATADNCNLVSGPSGYRAEFGPCGTLPVVPMAYAAPPAVVVPPTVMPGVAPPMIPAAAGCRPLFTLGQENYNVQLGQGIIGQPTAYVPGQSVRNFIRYLSP